MSGSADRGGSARVVVAVAVVGLLSTLGASLLGGIFASAQLETQLDRQRTAQVTDEKRQVYVDYLRATSEACAAIPRGDDEKVQAAAIEVLNQMGRVQLIGGKGVDQAVTAFTNAVVFEERQAKNACGSNENFVRFRDAFVEAATEELDPSEVDQE